MAYIYKVKKVKVKLDGEEFEISNWTVIPVHILGIILAMTIISHLCDIDVISINKWVVLTAWVFLSVSALYLRLTVFDGE